MAKVIIAIHGLRNKPPREILRKWGLMAIQEGVDNAGYDVKLPEFELVYWADILYDKPLSPDETDKESPYYLDEIYNKEEKNLHQDNHPVRLKIINFLKQLANIIFLKDDYQLRYPFLSKNFIHSNFRELEVYFTEDCDNNESDDCKAKNQINNRLVDVLRKHRNDEIFLVAHSMGSIIAFDVLSFFAKDIKVDTFVTIGSPLGAPFVISRIAKSSKRRNQGHIKLETPECITQYWYNFSDIMDNIALDYELANDFKKNSKGVKVVDKFVTNTYKMNGISNPHKSYGYLRTPEFIKVLVEFIKN